jgi:predicted AAA+ superfamily ATPase
MHLYSAKNVSLIQNFQMEQLFQYSQQLINQVDTAFTRYVYDRINWKNRLVGLVGFRGVGKTTLILQHIKKNLNLQETLYVTAEDFYFAKNRLIDLANDFVKGGGKYLFIDEIHKYPDWSKEIKLIYDYHQELNVVFTGSSILDIRKGSSDLSRRVAMYSMQGLSFREYLMLKHLVHVPIYSIDQILNHQVDIPQISHPLPLFKEYLKYGYYPFAGDEDFELKLQQVVNQTLEVDIPTYSQMNVSTGRKLKQLLAIVAQSVPFKPNMSKIAEMLNISRNNIADYLLYMEEAGMISQLRSQTGGIRALGKIEKVYLDNTNLVFALAKENQNLGNLRETFFLNQIRLNHQVTSSAASDFKIGDLEFELGGKNKGKKQLKNVEKGYLVKDDIEIGFLNTIPLWHFGLMY